MGVVACDKSISLDGYITGPNPGPELPLGEGGERIFAWMMVEAPPGGAASGMNEAWDDQFGDALTTTGAITMGRKSFDIIDSPDGWVAPGGLAFDWPVFVLTHRPMKSETKGVTPFTFVADGIESALEQARAIAGDRNIGLHGGSVVQQFLKAGLVDEIHLHVVPVFLGGGVRLFDNLDLDAGELECTSVQQSTGVTHLHYRAMRDS